MADGSAGVVYLDLIVRGADIRKQVDSMMSAVRESIRKSMASVEKSTQASMGQVAGQAAAGVRKAAESASKAAEGSLRGSFSRAVAMANIKVQELEREYARLSEAHKAAISGPDSDKGDKAAQALGAQRERAYSRLEAATLKTPPMPPPSAPNAMHFSRPSTMENGNFPPLRWWAARMG